MAGEGLHVMHCGTPSHVCQVARGPAVRESPGLTVVNFFLATLALQPSHSTRTTSMKGCNDPSCTLVGSTLSLVRVYDARLFFLRLLKLASTVKKWLFDTTLSSTHPSPPKRRNPISMVRVSPPWGQVARTCPATLKVPVKLISTCRP